MILQDTLGTLAIENPNHVRCLLTEHDPSSHYNYKNSTDARLRAAFVLNLSKSLSAIYSFPCSFALVNTRSSSSQSNCGAGLRRQSSWRFRSYRTGPPCRGGGQTLRPCEPRQLAGSAYRTRYGTKIATRAIRSGPRCGISAPHAYAR